MLWVLATGTGKTRTVAALIGTMINARVAQHVLFLVDHNALADQAREPSGVRRLLDGRYTCEPVNGEGATR